MKLVIVHLLIAVALPLTIFFGIDCLAHKRLPFLRLSAVDPVEGRKLFGANCLRCHNLDTSPWQKLGPNLNSVRSREHVVDGETLSVTEYVLQSILDPDAYRVPGFGVMPKNVVAHLTDDQLRDLVAFIVGPAHESDAARLEIPVREPPPEQIDITFVEAQLGEKVLREKGKCLNCHAYYQAPEYHALAPNLLQGGYKDVEAVKKAILNPTAQVAEEYKSTRVETVDGLVITGRRLSNAANTGLRLLVQASDGEFKIVKISDEEIDRDDEGTPLIEVLDISPMPADFDKQLTAEEIDAVAKLIVSLNE